MNKLKDTRVFGDLIVDDSLTKNNKEVATEEYVDTRLSTKQDKLTLNSGQVLGGTLSGAPEAVDTINISQIKVSDLNDGALYAKTSDIPTAVTNIATQRLLGRYSTGTGNVQPITLGSNLTLSTGGVLSATNTVYTHPNSGVTAGTYRSVTVNSQGHVTAGTNPTTLTGYGISLTGDVTNTNNTITIGPKKVTLSKIQNISTGKVLGRTSSGTGEVEAIDTVNINQIKVSDLNDGSSYALKTEIPTDLSQLTNTPGFTSNIGTVTQVKLGTTSYNPVSGVISLPAYPTVKTYSGSTSIILSGTSFQRAALTGDVTSSQNSNATTIKNNAVTFAKMQNISTNKVLGRTTSGPGVVEELDLIDINDLGLGAGTGTNWTQVWSGSTNLNSYTSSFYSATVPSGSYIGKRIAIEVQYGSGTTYTSKIIFGVLGSNSATAASTSISRGIGWSYFDGINLRVKTLYAFTSTSNTTTIYVGNLKTLFGTFSGSVIEWSTSHSETLYMRKIWVIE